MIEQKFKNSKFEATGETKQWLGCTFHRIRAVFEIPAHGVAAGDLGGWIEKEENLSTSGKAWVSENAHVFGNAWVSENARVCGSAHVFGNAWVSENAQVSGVARVCGKALVYENAHVFGNAWVSENAQVSGVTSKTPICIDGLRWHITIADQDMQIGCQRHAIERWWSFDNHLIDRMAPGALDFWKEHKAMLQDICAATGRPFLGVEKP